MADIVVAEGSPGTGPQRIVRYKDMGDGGVLVGPRNNAEYLKVAPDVVTYSAQGVELTRTRPTAFVQTHKWAGWGDKVVS